VTGVSAGALNTAGIAIFPIGEEKEMSEWLTSMWLNTTTKDIWTFWSEGFVKGIFQESGIFNDTALLSFVTNILESSGKLYKKIAVASCDAKTGSFNVYDEHTIWEELPTVIVGSASIPGVFPEMKY